MIPPGCRKRTLKLPDGLVAPRLTLTPTCDLAMTAAIRKALAENPKEFDPRKYMGPARTAVKELVRHKVRNVLCCAGHAFD